MFFRYIFIATVAQFVEGHYIDPQFCKSIHPEEKGKIIRTLPYSDDNLGFKMHAKTIIFSEIGLC